MILIHRAAALFALLLIPAIACAQVTLVDRQPDENLGSFINQEAPSQQAFSSYIVSNVTFDSSVTINSVTTYYDRGQNSEVDWSVLTGVFATLNIFEDPLTDSDDPTTGAIVPINITLNGNIHSLTASGLNITLGPGNYWIGMTPVIDIDIPQAFHWETASPEESRFRNPGGGFFGETGWLTGPEIEALDPNVSFGNYAITITGQVESAQSFPDSFQVNIGNLISGDLSDLLVSDDQYVRVFNIPAPSPISNSVEIEVVGTVADQSPAELTLTLEAATNGFPSQQRVQFRNFDAGTWDLVDVRSSPVSDTQIMVTISSNAGRYIQDGTGQVRARLGYRDLGAQQVGWSGRFDLVYWTTN